MLPTPVGGSGQRGPLEGPSPIPKQSGNGCIIALGEKVGNPDF